MSYNIYEGIITAKEEVVARTEEKAERIVRFLYPDLEITDIQLNLRDAKEDGRVTQFRRVGDGFLRNPKAKKPTGSI